LIPGRHFSCQRDVENQGRLLIIHTPGKGQRFCSGSSNDFFS
jgi:hypothetical protein